MKKFFLTLYFTCFTFLGVTAQSELPNNPQDISPLLIGEKIPSLTIQGLDSKFFSLEELTKNKKTVLIFYRGGWCPYCNLHLKAIAELESEILKKGYQIIAISPDSPNELKNTLTNDKINYSLYSDSSGELSKAFGIAFKAPENYKPYISKGSEGKNTDFLPVPSLFIINNQSEIIFEYVSPNYKNRISKELLKSIINTLK